MTKHTQVQDLTANAAMAGSAIEFNAERNPIVQIKDGEVFANSRDVAAYFGKRHDNVLRDIDNLLENNGSSKLRNLFVAESSYHEAAKKTVRHFEMTRDGFSLLAMGFTGLKALKWKLAYIDAFNAMEAELRRQTAVVDPNAITKSDLARLILESEEEKAQLQIENANKSAEIANLAPRAEAHDRFLDATGEVNLQMAMREIAARPRLAIRFLRDKGVMFNEGKNANTPKACYVQRGYFRVRTSAPDKHGNVYPQTMVTPRGAAWLDTVIPNDLRIGVAA